MTTALAEAASALIDILAEENAALAALDFTAAGARLAEKQAALDRLRALQEPPSARAAEAALVGRLRRLVGDNRDLLERAMLVQGRVIGVIARAAPSGRPGGGVYARGGGLAAPRGAPAVALSARV